MTKPSFFDKQLSIQKVTLAAVAILLLLGLVWWWSFEPLAKSLGYSKTDSSTTGQAVPPAPAPTEDVPEPNMNINRDIDLPKLYKDVQVGKDKDHLVDVAATGPSTCSTFQIPTLGAEELCTWVNNDKVVIFTMLNGEIMAKSKRGF